MPNGKRIKPSPKRKIKKFRKKLAGVRATAAGLRPRPILKVKPASKKKRIKKRKIKKLGKRTPYRL